jgi:hypothetical protein
MDILNFTIVTKSLYFENPVACYCPVENLFATTGALCPLDTQGRLEGPPGVYVSVSKNDDSRIYIYAEGIKRTYTSFLGRQIDTDLPWASEILKLTAWLNHAGAMTGFNIYISSDPVFRPEDFLHSISLGYASGMALINIFKLGVRSEDLREELIRMKFSLGAFP